MQVLTAHRVYQIRWHRHNEYSIRCSVINAQAKRTGAFGSSAHFLQIIAAAYDYAHRVFSDLLGIERDALRERRLFLRRKAHFNRLISRMQTQFQVDFWEAINEQFKSISSACDAGGCEDPLKTATVRGELEKQTAQINVLVSDSVDFMKEAFDRGRLGGAH